ncbi:hypothetical protein [Kitasatospora sp. NPDC087315]|uniref:hypothetical protein n=1 Tax=Kitasatospora sp. NPDC087315 TaxID=3364069 RepID=UPI0037F27E1C
MSTSRPVQPACADCGTTDLTFVHAAGAGWRRVLGRLLRRGYADAFPAWMRRQF